MKYALAVSLLINTSVVFGQTVPQSPLREWSVRTATFEQPDSKRMEATTVDEALAPFYHGVASGDPLPTAVIIWTRVTPATEGEVSVRWRVATDPALTNIVATGTTAARAERDYTVKVDVTGLTPGTVYYYNFVANGRASLTGRTRTASTGTVQQARLAVVSCSNYPFGYFNAYRAIARRNDLDAVLHLGDYIYEYAASESSYGGQIGIQLGRQHSPDNEIVTLADYRTRYSQYRLDPDLRALHQQHPVIHVWDDHESTNDSYTDGAENHQPNEGDWTARREISKRVCYEWMPTREQSDGRIYRSFSWGTLFDLWMIDTRLDGRDRQVTLLGDQSTPASRDSLNDPSRRIMSAEQFVWLTNSMSQSTATWKVLGNQVMFAPVRSNPVDTAFLFDAVGPFFAALLRPQLPALQAVNDQAFQGDVWNNYPAQRKNLVQSWVTNNVGNVIITTGDFHSALAFDVPALDRTDNDGPNRAVEFMAPSVTSANFDENLLSVPTTAAIAPALIGTLNSTLRKNNDFAKLINLVDHGYYVLDLTLQRAQADYFFMDTLLIRSPNERFATGLAVQSGSATLATVNQPSPGKPVQDVPAPEVPNTATSVPRTAGPVTVLSLDPMPADHMITVSWIARTSNPVTVTLVDMAGRTVRSVVEGMASEGLMNAVIRVHDLAVGSYQLVFNDGITSLSRTIIVSR